MCVVAISAGNKP